MSLATPLVLRLYRIPKPRKMPRVKLKPVRLVTLCEFAISVTKARAKGTVSGTHAADTAMSLVSSSGMSTLRGLTSTLCLK